MAKAAALKWIRGYSRDEGLCKHGIGHPIPGIPHHGGGVHGCDECCLSPAKRKARRAAQEAPGATIPPPGAPDHHPAPSSASEGLLGGLAGFRPPTPRRTVLLRDLEILMEDEQGMLPQHPVGWEVAFPLRAWAVAGAPDAKIRRHRILHLMALCAAWVLEEEVSP